MDDKFKKDFITLFNQGFEEVVLPVIEDMQGDIEEIKEDIKSLDNRVGNVENRLDRIENRLDSVVDNINGHNIRLKTIESIPIIAHELKIKK